MTPPARLAAAIDILDAIRAGAPIERALLTWARGHRFAGSKDRAAIRDIVFSVARRRASCAAMGGGADGRALVRGFLAQEGVEEATIFGAGGYAPAALGPDDAPLRPWETLSEVERADLQPWIWKRLQRDYGASAGPIAEALRHRAPVWLRVNVSRATRDDVARALAASEIECAPSLDCPGALRVTRGERRLAQHPVITGGLAEFQDIGPQRAVAALGVTPGLRVLDFCAGGGGKSLALAALGAQVTAHDSAPSRMKDLGKRAARARAAVHVGLEAGAPPFDLVVCDVPCSGSGAWRRAVEGKWQLTPEALVGLVERQRSIVAEAAAHLRPGGRLAYMTCSLLKAENEEQALYFSERYALQRMHQFSPLDGADGFFHAEFAAPG